MTYEGSCHCGAIAFAYSSELPPERWSVRSCQCSFCRAHGARCTSDPDGRVRFRISKPDELIRYRFALRTADFLICRSCGVYVGAVLESEGEAFAIVNLNALDAPATTLPEPRETSYDAESTSDRVRRRSHGWTPVEGDV